MTLDPFGTVALRERVLAGWAAAAVRLREDANAEEELVLGGYRDRVVVELAQNAADAALKAGVPGRLLLRLAEIDGRPVLVAANAGAPLDADGVVALSTLRASAKRDDAAGGAGGAGVFDGAGGLEGAGGVGGVGGTAPVGHFGVGFAAVLTVTDEPAVISRSGGVRFSAADSRAVVHDLAAAYPAGGLEAELARREGHVPVLRLPFPAEGTPPADYDTAVVLPLRDAAAYDVVLRRLDDVDDALLLALPGLAEVVIDIPGRPLRRLADVDSRWRVLRRAGALPADLLADRPVEERRRAAWQITWAVPRAAAGVDVPPALHAPTPTDEPLPWPALLIGTFPLESTRRHVVPGRLTDALVAHAARAYADLLAEMADDGDDVLPLVPVGLGAGALDGALREAVMPLLAAAPLIPAAADPGVLLRPRDACMLEPPAGRDRDAVRALAAGIGGLVVRRGDAEPALRALGVAEVGLADAVEALPALPVGPADPDPFAWHRIYQALDALSADPRMRESLAGLPVPLADGRVVRGPRGTVLPLRRSEGAADSVGSVGSVGSVDSAAALGVLGVRAVHPQAAHALLERLGAVVATPRALLELPSVRATVLEVASGEFDRPEEEDDVVDAVLGVLASAVADGEVTAGDLPWLGELPLVDADGEHAPACALVLPGSPAELLFDEAEFVPVSDLLLDRWGEDTLVAVGVRADLVLVRAEEVLLDPDLAGEPGPGDPGDLDRWAQWCSWALDKAADAGVDPGDVVVEEVIAVADLDAVAAAAWPEALARLAADREGRAALLASARLVHPRGALDVLGYTAWWLRRELVGGPVADPEAPDVVARLLPRAPAEVAGLDPAVRAALGCVRSLDDLGPDGLQAVLARLADAGTSLAPAQVQQAWTHVAVLAERLAGRGGATASVSPAPPARVRVVDGVNTRVVSTDTVTVVDNPAHLQLYPPAEAISVAPEHAWGLAELLDVPVSGDEVRGVVVETGVDAGQLTPVPSVASALLGEGPTRWCEHERLVVDGVEVQWWVDGVGDGPAAGCVVHASTLHGLASGLAWSRRRWPLRHALAEVLEDPDAVGRLLAEGVFD